MNPINHRTREADCFKFCTIEKEIQLFLPSEISINLSYFFLYTKYFLMVWNAFRILSSIAFETVKSQTEEKQIISGILVSFSNFSNFRKFRNRLWYEQISDELSVLLELEYFFIKILTHYKKDLN